jgi:uncharacterized protein (DUF1810 family)
LSLERFVTAQAPIYDRALRELWAGRKQSHWMWFVFPQIAGLGHSAMAQSYAIESLEEARAYLAHPLLGARLREFTRAVLDVEGKTAREIFGSPDDLKFRSCLTLFVHTAPDEPLFRAALNKYFGGDADPLTAGRPSVYTSFLPASGATSGGRWRSEGEEGDQAFRTRSKPELRQREAAKESVRWPVSRVLSFLRRGDHSSGMSVTTHLTRPTRTADRKSQHAVPIWSCSRWGLPSRLCYQRRGALLPHHFNLAGPLGS